MSIVEIDKVAGKRPKLAYNWPGPFRDYDQIGKGRAAVNRGESPPVRVVFLRRRRATRVGLRYRFGKVEGIHVCV